MKKVALLHNPNAGDEAHSKEKLVYQLEDEGYKCRYSSTKEKGWDKLKDDTDLVVIAGGDGTVRKVWLKFFGSGQGPGIPFALLPLGTANNIAGTMGIQGSTIDIIRSWKEASVKKIDLGSIEGAGLSELFLEGFGGGLFPRLMKEMKSTANPGATPEEQLVRSLELLHGAVLSAPAGHFRLIADGNDLSGDYLMMELMNMRSIGPNLVLAPEADPGDGKFEVVLVRDDERGLMAEHVRRKMTGLEEDFPLKPVQAVEMNLTWNGKSAHADDTFLKPESGQPIRVKPIPGAVSWLQPKVEGNLRGEQNAH